jgi:OmcA/MtrC family decaheme c-type cytochrome
LIPLGLLAALIACTDGGGGSNDGGTGAVGNANLQTKGSTPEAQAEVDQEPVESRTSLESCRSCHGAGQSFPVADITRAGDAHFVDPDPDGPLTDSGYRRIDATIDRVDVTGTSVVIEFEAFSEAGAAVDDLVADDGRFAIARVETGTNGDPNEWVNLGSRSTENFTSGLFENLSAGSYRYTSALDPTGLVTSGDSIRVAIQLSASDLPAENAWCDFDADLAAPNSCGLGTAVTRDIVQTTDCNVCHGPTSETKLVFHGARTDVEYCVTCHNPTRNTDMTLLVHKIHAGASLENGFRGYSDVNFTKDLDNCQVCHTGGGADQDNWKEMPNRVACGSCHDDVNFDTGQNHGAGGVQRDNSLCSGCHPPDGPLSLIQLPVATVHRGERRSIEAASYRGGTNGFAIEDLQYTPSTGEISVIYSVTRNGSRMTLETDPQWTSGGSLTLALGWDTVEYSNTGSGSTPAQPVRIDALDIGGAITALGSGRYQATIVAPSSAANTVTVHLEGRPVENPATPGSTGERIPVASVIDALSVAGGRSQTEPRREIVDPALCNVCHDASGAGLSFHGTNRTGEMAVCSVCHNPDATDINRRPADPSTTPDMKREESIDFKRMIQQIHAGSSLTEGLVLYGFSGTPHEYESVDFVGNLANCETCHVAGGYSADAARAAGNSTIHTGDDLADPSDDLNISSTAATCSSCHDDDPARSHMELFGASFQSLDADIQ